MNIDLFTLKLFVAVVEEQGVAKAAEREHIAGSAVLMMDTNSDQVAQMIQKWMAERGLMK